MGELNDSNKALVEENETLKEDNVNLQGENTRLQKDRERLVSLTGNLDQRLESYMKKLTVCWKIMDENKSEIEKLRAGAEEVVVVREQAVPHDRRSGVANTSRKVKNSDRREIGQHADPHPVVDLTSASSRPARSSTISP